MFLLKPPLTGDLPLPCLIARGHLKLLLPKLENQPCCHWFPEPFKNHSEKCSAVSDIWAIQQWCYLSLRSWDSTHMSLMRCRLYRLYPKLNLIVGRLKSHSLGFWLHPNSKPFTRALPGVISNVPAKLYKSECIITKTVFALLVCAWEVLSSSKSLLLLVVPPNYKLVCKPNYGNYGYITNKNQSEIGVMFTNLEIPNWGTTL